MTTNDASSGQDHFDLLPYVSILRCVLGCLLLVTLGVAALSLGPAAGEGWLVVRSPESSAKPPVLVEWDGKHAVVHGRGGSPTRAAWLAEPPPNAGTNKEDIAALVSLKRSDEMLKLLAVFASRRATEYPLFAVRPGGFASFELFADDFREKGIDVGYEPIGQSRTLILTLKEDPK